MSDVNTEAAPPFEGDHPESPLVFPCRGRRLDPEDRVGLVRGGAFIAGGILALTLLDRFDVMQGGIFAILIGLYFVVPRVVHWLRRSGRPIVLDAEGIVIPGGVTGRREVRVPFDRIDSLLDNVRSREDGRGARAVLGTRWRNLVLDGDDFVEDDGLPRLIQGLLQGIVARDGGADRIRDLDRRRRSAWTVLTRKNPVTLVLLALLVVLFAVQHVRGAYPMSTGLAGQYESVMRTLEMGSNAPALVARGQIYRLVTANFLHGGPLHLGVNALALFLLGRLLERLLGSFRFFLVYAAGAVAGAGASALVGAALQGVGASTAIFGLIGAFAAIHLRFGPDLPVGIRQSRRWWVIILAINCGISFVPMVDWVAHLGGFAGGFLVAWPLVGRTPEAASPRFAKPVARAVAAIFIVCGAWAVNEAVFHAERIRWMGRQELASGGAFPDEQINELAWSLAIDPDARPEALEAAGAALRSSMDRNPGRHHWIDTMATIRHRTGRRDEAIRLEREALLLAPSQAVYAAQLARFLAAGPTPILEDGVPLVEVTIRDGQTVEIAADRSTATGLVVLAFLRGEDGRRVGFMKLLLPPGMRWSHAGGKFPGDTRVEIALVETTDNGPETLKVRAWPEDDEVAGYP